ncbi:MAG: hypothetical protein AUJ92_11630 [Armatimonadetes bacterium CG2_30_59_28]|nr:MAG: hypothetical protein AUJ92_11630 [Armatimonadetes bacterium CG2_30_59_28]
MLTHQHPASLLLLNYLLRLFPYLSWHHRFKRSRIQATIMFDQPRIIRRFDNAFNLMPVPSRLATRLRHPMRGQPVGNSHETLRTTIFIVYTKHYICVLHIRNEIRGFAVHVEVRRAHPSMPQPLLRSTMYLVFDALAGKTYLKPLCRQEESQAKLSPRCRCVNWIVMCQHFNSVLVS